MAAHDSLFLVGLMGAGKTTVGKQLARRLGKTFIDCDHELEQRTGVSIPTIFELEGEAGFRNREEALVAELAQLPDIVLATGGGVVIREANRRTLLAAHGLVIYLRAHVDDLWRRTRHDKNRPLLQTADPRARLLELFRARDPLYREVADIIVDTGEQSVQKLTRHLVAEIQQHSGTSPSSPGESCAP